QPPMLSTSRRPGCPFQPRCPIGRDHDLCRHSTPPLAASRDSLAACHFPGRSAFEPTGVVRHRPAAPEQQLQPLFRLSGIEAVYPLGNGPFWEKKRVLRAVGGVDLDVLPGEALGIVGESGAGKSTVARVMMR